MMKSISVFILFGLCFPVLPFLSSFDEFSTKIDGPRIVKISDTDGSKIVDIKKIDVNAQNGFTIVGTVLKPGQLDLEKDRESAIQSLQTAIDYLKSRVKQDGLTPEEIRDTDVQLKHTERYLEGIKLSAQTKKNPNFSMVYTIVLEGKNQTSSAQYIATPITTDIRKLPNPDKDMVEFRFDLGRHFANGSYTIFLTPMDTTSINGHVVLGGTELVSIEIK